MNILLGYLIGQRRAIQEIAANRMYLVIGLIFVLSAGFAREYDGTDLTVRPLVVFRPLVASLVSASLLYALLVVVRVLPFAWKSNELPLHGYLTFLSLFWMTAPLAWLYAVPVERFLDPVESVRANWIGLGIVAFWRVVLISRVTSVLSGRNLVACLFIVMLYSDSVVLALLFNHAFRQEFGVNLLEAMAGIRPYFSPAAQMTKAIVTIVGLFALNSFLLWLVGSVLLLCWTKRRPPDVYPVQANRIRPALWVLAGLSLAVWLGVLPFFQPEQRARTRINQAFQKASRKPDVIRDSDRAQLDRDAATLFRKYVDLLATYTPADLPPHYMPPPDLSARNLEDILAVLEAIEDQQVHGWVRETYLDKFRLAMQHLAEQESYGILAICDMGWLRPERLEAVLSRLPEGREIKEEFLQNLQTTLQTTNKASWEESFQSLRQTLFPGDAKIQGHKP